jgi:bifunctional ADP-heptose synthase (sugar kinase/adenylyltransferase)
MGDRLIVALTTDLMVRKEKGQGRPVFRQIQRGTCLMLIRGVDEVIFCDDVMDVLKARKPDIFVKGKDYRGKIKKEHAEYCRANGIEIRFTDTDKYSSTALLHHYAS